VPIAASTLGTPSHTNGEVGSASLSPMFVIPIFAQAAIQESGPFVPQQ
jgi:hypothetical protein